MRRSAQHTSRSFNTWNVKSAPLLAAEDEPLSALKALLPAALEQVHVVAVTGRIFVDKGLVHGPNPWTFRNHKIPINGLRDTVEPFLHPRHMEIVEGFLDEYIRVAAST
jgi:hypothetical protein